LARGDGRMMRGRATRGSRWRWLTAPLAPDSLSGFALAGFSILSGFATAQGFADLRAANTETGRLGPADLILTYATSAFVIAAMIVALHNAFAPGRQWAVRMLSGVFYLFFAIWSVGFGYGFFWKELAGQEFTRTQFERMLTEASGSLSRASLALESAEQAVRGAAGLARERAETEAMQGGTCVNRPGSSPGDGPLTRGRFAFADRAAATAEDVRTSWIGPLTQRRDGLQRQMAALQGRILPEAPAAEREVLDRLSRAGSLGADERRALYLGVYADVRGFTDDLNAMRELQAPSVAARLTALAADVSADPDRASDPEHCIDAVLRDRLQGAAGQVSGIAAATAPEFEVIEGAKATRAAFFGLVDHALGLAGGGPSGDFPFGAREGMALFASLAVDLGIVFLTLVRLAPRRRERMSPGIGAPRPPVLSTILPPER
jgi:hypothetical protein